MARKQAPFSFSGHTLLVVDDQEEICLITRLLLERHGHRVLTARDGEKALALFQPGQIDLLIVDYCMPGMSGEEVIQAIRARDTLVPILLQTGYSGMQAPEELFSPLDIQGHHDKLAGPSQLLRRVETALRERTQCRQTAQENSPVTVSFVCNDLDPAQRHPIHLPITS